VAPLSGPRAASVAAGLTAAVAAAPPADPAAQGTLAVNLVHRFERGTVYVRIDGTEAAKDRLSGRGGKTRWSRSFTVAAGHRRLEVRVAGEGIDEIDGIDIDVPVGGQRAVSVSLNALTRRLKVRPADGESAGQP
jgi:hypothetical protein